MKTIEISSKNNGSRYFSVRILIRDNESYERVASYLMETAIRVDANEEEVLKGKMNYIFDKRERQVARTNRARRIIELTKEVKEEIRSEIEKIVMRYST